MCCAVQKVIQFKNKKYGFVRRYVLVPRTINTILSCSETYYHIYILRNININILIEHLISPSFTMWIEQIRTEGPDYYWRVLEQQYYIKSAL